MEGTNGDHLVQSPSWVRCTEKVAQGCVQLGFEYLHRRIPHNLLGQTVPVFNDTYIRKVFSYFSYIFLSLNGVSHISVCAHHLLHCHWHHCLPLLYSSITHLYTWIRRAWAFFVPGRAVPIFPAYMTSSPSPLIIFVALYWTLSSKSLFLLYWEAWHQALPVLSRGRITSFDLMDMIFMQSRRLLAFYAVRKKGVISWSCSFLSLWVWWTFAQGHIQVDK